MDQEIKQKPNMLKYVGISMVLFIVAYLIFDLFSDKSKLRSIERDRLRTTTAVLGPYYDMSVSLGKVISNDITFIDSAATARVDDVFYKVGDSIKANQIIVKLSNPKIILDAASKQAEIVNLINNLLTTEISLETSLQERRLELINRHKTLKKLENKAHRLRALIEKDSISKEELEDVLIDLEAENKIIVTNEGLLKVFEALYSKQLGELRETVKILREKLDLTNSILDDLEVKSFADGVITEFNVEKGQQVSPGTRIARVENPSSLELEVFLDQSYIPQLNKDFKALVDINNKTLNLTVARVLSKVESDGTVPVYLEITPDNLQEFVPGQQLTVRFEFSSNDAIFLKFDDYLSSSGGHYVFVLEASEKFATKRKVEIGKTNGRQVEILSGLEAGEKIISSSYKEFEGVEKIMIN